MLRRIFWRETTSPIDPLITKVLEEMEQKGPFSDGYNDLLRDLERLYEIKNHDRLDPVSRDTLAMIAGNLLGILLIVAYEQKHVVTSKGFAQIIRPMRSIQ